MEQKETTKFVSFEIAFMSAQVLCFYFARLGYLFTLSGKFDGALHEIEVTIFHKKGELLTPPTGYIYSESHTNHSSEFNYWTNFLFEY